MRRRYHCSKKEASVAIQDRLDRRRGERGVWVFGFAFEEREKGKTRMGPIYDRTIISEREPNSYELKQTNSDLCFLFSLFMVDTLEYMACKSRLVW